MARKIIVTVGLVVLVLSMAWVRVAIDGHRARGQGDELLDAGRADEAVGYYDRALHMYWPGSPDVAHAVTQLSDLAAQREAADDVTGALHVWRVLRSGLYASRGLFQPYPEVIQSAEKRIAILVAKQAENPLVAEAHLKKLQESHDPHKGWSLLALLGFALWAGGAAAFLWRGLTPAGKLVPRQAVTWALVFVAGYAVWLVSLYLA